MTFEAESEYLYQKKIEELQAEIARLHEKYDLQLLVKSNAEKDREIERLKSRASQFESTMTETMRVRDEALVELAEEIKLRRGFATSSRVLNDKLATCVEALEKIATVGVRDGRVSVAFLKGLATEALERIRKGQADE